MPGLDLNATYDECTAEARAQVWHLDEVLPHGTRLDFELDFLPASLTEHASLDFLSPLARRRLNQITAKAYVNLFCFVEEYIVADVQDFERAESIREAERAAFHFFAAEEIKHQALFSRYMAAFDEGFGTPCRVLDFSRPIADMIRSNGRIGVLLTTLHLEIITQEHYTAAVAPAQRLDPTMVKILAYHWRDERRHAQIDLIKLKELCAATTAKERAQALSEYADILKALDGLFAMQAGHDRRSLEAATGQALSARRALALETTQHSSYRRLFIELGLADPTLSQALSALMPDQMERLARLPVELFGARRQTTPLG